MDNLKAKKKPFVEPSLKEEASLEDVTLMSGGHGKKGKNGHNEHHNNGPNKPQGKPGGRHT